MNAERWKQIDELFDAVLEVPEKERESYLSSKCNGDEDLKREVLSLLAAQNQTINFMEISAMNLMGKAIADEKEDFADNSLYNKTLGNYKIEKPLGVGGMGEVYLAHDTKLNRKVALKILPKEFVSDDERVHRFELEARTVSALNHPYIVTVYDVGKIENVHYIATEYVEGKTVRDLIGEKPSLKETLSIISQTAEALDEAHRAGIIHRDIKPENIMVRPDGYVKVLDFGLAKLIETNDRKNNTNTQTMKGVIIGTLAYMSPEQIVGDRLDRRTDIWSLSVVLFEMLTGKNPFKGENRNATYQNILSEESLHVSELNGKIPDDLDRVLVKALEKDADLRYQTASDLRADLKRVRRDIDSSPSLRNTGGTESRSKQTAKRNYLYYGFAVIFLLLFGAGSWFLFIKPNYFKSGEAIEWSNAKNIQLTNFSGIKGYPSLSPDGKSIVYTNETENGTDIFQQRIGGKNPINLTADSKANDTMAAYSPDGKLIAFRSERSPAGIYVMEETGENVRRISDFGLHPSWSPDGKQIVVCDRAADVATTHTIPNSSLWVIDVETGSKKKLDTKGDAIQPNWSPNGQRIVFWFVRDGHLGELATIPADGGEPVTIAENEAMDWNPIWSPDGKYIFFGSDRSGSMNIWRAPIDEQSGKSNGNPESVGSPATYIRHLAFSRDGKTIAFIRYETKSNLQTIAFDPATLKISGEAEMVTRGNQQLSHPELSPNGEQFVFRGPGTTQEDIVIFNRDGSNPRNLTNDKFRDRTPHWSPDGKKIVSASDRSGKYQIWMLNADGSDLRQITFSEKTGASIPVLSPDGARLIYAEIDDKIQTPFILDLTKSWDQQTSESLPPPPDFKGSYTVLDWSNDSKKLLLSFSDQLSGENSLRVFNFDTLTYEKMTDSGGYPIWLKDNRHFIFDRKKSLYICDTQTKKITELYKPPTYEIQNANISPDNKMIYFRYLQVDSDVWLLDASQKQ